MGLRTSALGGGGGGGGGCFQIMHTLSTLGHLVTSTLLLMIPVCTSDHTPPSLH